MRKYYSKKEEDTWGVLGIEIRLLNSHCEDSPIAKAGGAILSAALHAAMPDTAVVLNWAQGCTTRGRVEAYEHRVAVN